MASVLDFRTSAIRVAFIYTICNTRVSDYFCCCIIYSVTFSFPYHLALWSFYHYELHLASSTTTWLFVKPSIY